MKLLFRTLTLIGILFQNVIVQADLISDLINSGSTIVEGVVKEIPNIIPTEEELFKLPTQSIIGLEETAEWSVLNQLCSAYLATDTVKPPITPNMDKMSFRLRTPCKEFTYSLSETEKIFDNPEFDVNKKVVIYISGWRVSSELPSTTDMAIAFTCRGDYNFLAFNSSDGVDTELTWASYNTQEVARELAKGIEKLLIKVPVENIYIIGHSLGAHIAGFTGRYFTKYTGLNITRITGLDPAKPCFNEGAKFDGIQRGDAEFIDIMHTNPGVFAKREPLGDVDYYAGGLSPFRPGCYQYGCSHIRAVAYFIESVYPGNENNFLGVRCTSLKKVKDGFCNGPKFPMGFAIPFNLKGNYFFDVNAKPPYGQNNEGREVVPSQCKKC